MKTNTEYKNAALAALKGNWAKAVLATVVLMAIIYIGMGPYMANYLKMQRFMAENFASASDPSLVMDPEYLALMSKTMIWWGVYLLFVIFVVQPMCVGYDNANLRLLRVGENDILGNTYQIATKKYWRKVWGMFLMGFYIFLWSLLLVIPGIIKMFSYSMTPYILEENPELSADEAIDRSRAMMKGHKFDLFWLILSFIGWFILCGLTLGIGLLWLMPYLNTTMAAFYEDVKADYEQNGGLN